MKPDGGRRGTWYERQCHCGRPRGITRPIQRVGGWERWCRHCCLPVRWKWRAGYLRFLKECGLDPRDYQEIKLAFAWELLTVSDIKCRDGLGVSREIRRRIAELKHSNGYTEDRLDCILHDLILRWGVKSNEIAMKAYPKGAPWSPEAKFVAMVRGRSYVLMSDAWSE
jgi:hypothetical protein